MGEVPSPSSTPQSPFIITEFGRQTSSTPTLPTMRLLCIPLFLAVAIRPVGAGAHAKTTDKFEVQGNLRVQESAHDKSDEERMNSGLEDLLSTVHKEDEIYILESSEVSPSIQKGASDMTNMNLNTRKRAIETLISPEKKAKTLSDEAQTFLDNLRKQERADMLERDPPSFFDKAVPDGTSRPVLDRIVAEIQDFF